VPYDAIKDFTPIGMIGGTPNVLVVNASLPINNIKEFIEYIKKNPGKLNYGSAGSGTPLHLAGAIYDLLMGTRMTHVAYRGAALATADLLAGQVQVVFGDVGSAAPHIKAGTLRLLAVCVPNRLAAYPDIPTMAESDARLREFDIYTWAMLSVPKATPDLPVQRLHAAIAEAAKQPELQPRYAELGFDLINGSPAEGDAVLAREQAKWAKLIKAAGIKADL
jgi:tripartite-type tricarboxylate transporter receptor subunit TctC